MHPALEALKQSRFFRKLRAIRGVAQPGRALSSGGRGQRFKSSHPDQKIHALTALSQLLKPFRLPSWDKLGTLQL